MVIVDASAVIDYLEKRGVSERVRELRRAGLLATNVVVRYEVLSGIPAGTKRDREARKVLFGIPCRILHQAALERSLEIVRELKKSGGKGDIGPRDTLIAGMALHHGDSVLTGNRQHFERVDGLELDPGSR